MQTAITAITETEAVNRILSTVGGEKVANLTSLSLIADSAYTELRNSLRDLQSHPWGFNTEYEVVLTPADNKITFDGSEYTGLFVANVDLAPQHAGDLDVVVRDNAGTRSLYDRKEHKFSAFTGTSYKATIQYYLQYEDCPEVVKVLAMAMAAINFQAIQVGNAQIDLILRQQLAAAKAAFMSYEASQEAWSIFDNYDFFKIVASNQRPQLPGSTAAGSWTTST
jgi:hypothetical protein